MLMRTPLLILALGLSLVGSARADCPVGDLSGDFEVNWEDLGIFVNRWLAPPGCDGHPNDCADLDGANGVDMADFALLAESRLVKTVTFLVLK